MTNETNTAETYTAHYRRFHGGKIGSTIEMVSWLASYYGGEPLSQETIARYDALAAPHTAALRAFCEPLAAQVKEGKMSKAEYIAACAEAAATAETAHNDVIARYLAGEGK